MAKADLVVSEFCITVYSSGKIDWDGADELMRRRLHEKPKDLKAFERDVLAVRSRRREGRR